MNDYFVFGSIDTRNYGVLVFDMNTDEGPEREQEKYSVPGRNGDLVGNTYRLANKEHQYMGIIYESFESRYEAFRDILIATGGKYLRLADSIHPDEFYLARYVGPLEPTIPKGRDMGKFMIEFDRKPQRFLFSGEEEVSITSGGTLVNPTRQYSQPLIHVTGYGNLYINSGRITVKNTFSDVYIDCEMMDCYHGTENANDDVIIREVDFPTLRPGSNSFSFADTITSVSIVPRWWRA